MASAVVAYCICFGAVETPRAVVSRDQSLLQPHFQGHRVILSAALQDAYYAIDGGNEINRTQHLIKAASASLNADWSGRCEVVYTDEESGSHIPVTLPPPWTTWTSFLLPLFENLRFAKEDRARWPHARFPHATTEIHRGAISKLIGLFLSHGAQPSATFVGYCFPPSPPARGADPSPPIGPYSVSLLDMMDVWGLQPTVSTRRILSDASRDASQHQTRSWVRPSFDWLPWSKQQTQAAGQSIPPLGDIHRAAGCFVPLRIVPYSDLPRSVEGLEHIANVISRRGGHEEAPSFPWVQVHIQMWHTSQWFVQS